MKAHRPKVEHPVITLNLNRFIILSLHPLHLQVLHVVRQIIEIPFGAVRRMAPALGHELEFAAPVPLVLLVIESCAAASLSSAADRVIQGAFRNSQSVISRGSLIFSTQKRSKRREGLLRLQSG